MLEGMRSRCLAGTEAIVWVRVKTSDDRLRALRDKHYSCKRPGGRTVGPPGRRVAFVTEDGGAAWLSHWPKPELAMHGYGDAWICTLFRREWGPRSSELISAAVAATARAWGEPPSGGFLTFVDVDRTRHKRDPGRCFRRAGFKPIGYTKDRGLLILHLTP